MSDTGLLDDEERDAVFMAVTTLLDIATYAEQGKLAVHTMYNTGDAGPFNEHFRANDAALKCMAVKGLHLILDKVLAVSDEERALLHYQYEYSLLSK